MINQDLEIVSFYTEINSTQVNYIVRCIKLAEIKSRNKNYTSHASNHILQPRHQ